VIIFNITLMHCFILYRDKLYNELRLAQIAFHAVFKQSPLLHRKAVLTFMHLAGALICSNLNYIQGIPFISL